MDFIRKTENRLSDFFDKMEEIWEGDRFHLIVGVTLVLSFVLALFFIELKRRGLLPENITFIPSNHFYAIYFSFYLLLIIEVISLVFSLVHSVANSLGKQFELISLILLRESFKELSHFPEPLTIQGITSPIIHIIVYSSGALLIFITTGIYYRLQKHQPITRDDFERGRFINAKKMLSLLLLIVFISMGTYTVVCMLSGFETPHFFGTFFTVLIFSDILVVLVSLRYCQNYYNVFRNSGFSVATILIRLALVAPVYYNVALALIASVFTLVLTVAYNYFVKPVKAPGFKP